MYIRNVRLVSGTLGLSQAPDYLVVVSMCVSALSLVFRMFKDLLLATYHKHHHHHPSGQDLSQPIHFLAKYFFHIAMNSVILYLQILAISVNILS